MTLYISDERWAEIALVTLYISDERWAEIALVTLYISDERWAEIALVTLYISDERWAEIALRDWEIDSLSQSVELRQAASSQIVHLNIKSFHLYYLFTNK